MATRYRVARQSIRFGKKTYRKGELLPESFSERDLYRVLYPSRIEKVEVADGVVQTEAAKSTESEAASTPVTTSQASKPAETPAAPTKPIGASLSGQAVVKK